MRKYKNKYRIDSHRRRGWNYNRKGLYFITIVTQNRECILGRINEGAMIPSDFGVIVNQEWYKSFRIRDELILHEYILMPNHLHAIVELRNITPIETNGRSSLSEHGRSSLSEHGRSSLSEHDRSSLSEHGRSSLSEHDRPPSHPNDQQFMPKRLPKSISSFLAGFKCAVNSKIDDYIDENQLNIPKYNRKNHFFQPNYHDRIIRNKYAYHRIKKYIIDNPRNWNG